MGNEMFKNLEKWVCLTASQHEAFYDFVLWLFLFCKRVELLVSANATHSLFLFHIESCALEVVGDLGVGFGRDFSSGARSAGGGGVVDGAR